VADPVTLFKLRGQDWIALICECGQKQQSPDDGEHRIVCASCGKDHIADG